MPELVDEKPLWSSYWLDPFLPRFSESFVGVFGWMNVFLPRPIYGFYLVLLALAVAGLVHWTVEATRRERSRMAFLVLLVGLCLAGVAYYNLTYTQYQGRFLFPVIAPVATIAAIGLGQWLLHIERPSVRAVSVSLLYIALIVVNVVSLLVQWEFHYRTNQYM